MKHRNKLILGLVLLAAPLFASAQTLFFGWTFSVGYTDGTSTGAITPTHNTCLQLYYQAIGNPPAGAAVDYSKTYPCTRIYEELPVLVDDIPWDDCLVCGRINEDILSRIYPEEHFREAVNILNEYNIEGYQKDLAELQQQYDLNGYQDAMNEFEQSIAR